MNTLTISTRLKSQLFTLVQGILTLALTLLGLLVITFTLSAFSPVDPVLQIVGDHASIETYNQVKHELGLDLPIYMQFFHYVEALLQGNLGTATSTGQPVFDDLIATFPATLELATVALVIGASLG
ncbi:ABC transporter permease, partial [Proteus mirabilis]